MKMVITHTITLTEDICLLDVIKNYPDAFERISEGLWVLREGFLIQGYSHLYWPININFVLPKGWVSLKWMNPKMQELFQEFLATGMIPKCLMVKYSWPVCGRFIEKANPFTCYPCMADRIIVVVIDTLAGESNPSDFTGIYDLEFSKMGFMNDKETHAALLYV